MLRGPVGLDVFSCGIRVTPLGTLTDSCSLPKNSKKPSVGSVSSSSSPFRKGTSLAVCYYSVLSGPHVVTSINSVLQVLPL